MGKTWSRRGSKTPKKPRKSYRIGLLVGLLAVLAIGPILAADAPRKGDFLLGGGWAYSAPKDATGERLGDWTATLEYMLTDKLSIRADYYRLNEIQEDNANILASSVDDPQGISLTLAPHVGNVSFPVGMVGMNTPDRHNAEFGAVGGAFIDFWTSKHVGLGFGGNYLFLQNTTIGQDSYDVRGELRLKF